MLPGQDNVKRQSPQEQEGERRNCLGRFVDEITRDNSVIAN